MKNNFPTRHEFSEEGVTVVVYPGPKAIKPEKHVLPREVPMEPVPGVCTPIRMVINLKMKEIEIPNSEVFEFDPAIEVHVKYRAEDYDAAKGHLCLAIWDGTQWSRVAPEKIDFQADHESAPRDGGKGMVKFTHWGDPTIAWAT